MSDILTTAAKIFYTDLRTQSEKAVETVLFNKIDENESAAFRLDSLIKKNYIVYARRNGESIHSVSYQAGSGIEHEVPKSGVSTELDETLRDTSTVGVDQASSWLNHNEAKLRNITMQHYHSIRYTKAKTAFDVLRTGKFMVLGSGGALKEYTIDFKRAGSNSKTFAKGTNVFEAIGTLINALVQHGCPTNQILIIVGSGVMAQLTKEQIFYEAIKAQTGASFNVHFKSLEHSEIAIAGQLIIPGTGYPVSIASYHSTDNQNGDIFAENEMFLLAENSPRYLIRRGVDVISKVSPEKLDRMVGEVVVDAYLDGSSNTQSLRSHYRECYVPGNANHTAYGKLEL